MFNDLAFLLSGSQIEVLMSSKLIKISLDKVSASDSLGESLEYSFSVSYTLSEFILARLFLVFLNQLIPSIL